MRVLGIETSCDETAAAVVEDGRLVHSNIVSSQLAVHSPYGGVVPELAAREQVTAILPVVEAALTEAGLGFDEVDAIAVTQGPGLAGSLLVGVNVAKTVALLLGKPLVGVHHLEGHIAANWLIDTDQDHGEIAFPAVCLVVSGGHTELVLMAEAGSYRGLGATIDDAAGEAFDKAARSLGLGYPGGPAIQKAAAVGDPSRVPMPRAWLGESLDFSFSGLKTALLRAAEPYRLPPEVNIQPRNLPFAEHRPPRYRDDLPLADLAAAFQEAVVDVLAVKTVLAADAFGARTVMLAGGVAANAALRDRLLAEAQRRLPERTRVIWPHLRYCTDNAAMIAGAAHSALSRGDVAGLEMDVLARWPLTEGREHVRAS